MSTFWFVPPVVLLAAVACWAVCAHEVQRSLDAIREQLRELASVRAEVDALRAETARARAARRTLHDR